MTRTSRILRRVVHFLVIAFMNTSQAEGRPPARPMQGPDFVVAKVANWIEQPGGDSLLTLADGSRWRLDSRRPDYQPQVTFIVNALRKDAQLLVSGDRQRGVVERTAAVRELAVARVDSLEEGRRYAVLFHGPPSIYYLRMDRPHASDQLGLLRRSSSSRAFMDDPDLLVGIDTVVSEIVIVKALERRASGPMP